MKNKLTETKSKSGIGLTRHLISGVLCLAVISLFCARASAQNLFAVDAAQGNINGSIDEFTPNGVRSTFASGLNIPVGLACDKSGNLFVADAGTGAVGSRAVYKFTLAGVRTTFASGISGSLACDSMGNLFVADGGNILKFTPYGVRSTFASELFFPQGLAFDRAGNLFVAAGGDIYKFTPTGVRTTFAFGLASPFALAFDSMGNLFVADGGTAINYDFFVGAAVYKFTPSGLRSTVASQNDKVSVSPGGLAIDSADNLFVADLVIPGSMLKFTPSGVRTTFAARMVTALAFQPTLTPTPTLINISARGSVETGEGALIAGFIVTGTDSKQVVIRGLGPTLTQHGVSGALADPFLSLFDGSGNVLWNNNDWKDSQQAIIQTTGKAPPNDLESAILRTLAPGNYTAILSGRNGTTGIGLVEVYDVATGALAELTNVSTRCFVGTGQAVMIGGFITAGGNGSTQIVVRGLGPTLTQKGVTDPVLADPFLSLRDGNGNLLWNNNDWKDSQQAEIQATGLAPPNDLESAIVRTVAPGNYTAILSGRNGTTGIGLVEVYKVAVATNK
jgi:sugar lactone lactonase YvrE